MYNLVDIHFHTDDSFDAFNNEPFDIDTLIRALKDTDSNYNVKLLCKTDHNILNFSKYLEMAKKFDNEGITLLPGIEISASGNIHWIFIFDDTVVCEGIPENSDYFGQTLDNKINEYFGYDTSDGERSILEQAKNAQSVSHEIKGFIKILHELNIPYIAIPHLNKTNGWYERLKKDSSQLNVVEEYLNSNIVNGFESKNQDDFITLAIQQTESVIKDLKHEYEKLESSQTEEDKEQFRVNIEKRITHLKKLISLNNSIKNGDAALIYGSDFHCRKGETIESYREYKKNLFFIKAFPTFEGLRISLLDQYSRIFTLERKLKYSKDSIQCIDHVVLEQSGEETIIPFGDGLNSIIGARGTGKSYLLSLLAGKVEKYTGSAIAADIKLSNICFSNGEEKKFLSPADYDILTQRGSGSSEQSENSIYGLLADAPFKMSSYIEEIKKLDPKPTRNLKIQNLINQINLLIDSYIEINSLRESAVNLSFFNIYNKYYSDKSDNIKLSDLFSGAEQSAETEKTQIDETVSQLNMIQSNAETLLEALTKVESQKNFSQIGISFNDEKELLLRLRDEKLVLIIDFYKRKRQIINRILKILNLILVSIRQDSSNVENTLTENVCNLNDFITSACAVLRKTKKVCTEVYDQSHQDIIDEEIFRINVGQQTYEIKTISRLNLYNLSHDEFEKLLLAYKIEYKPDIFNNCFKYEFWGKDFIDKIYVKLDHRRRDYHLEMPKLEKELFLNFDGSFKNWASLSPGQRADKLLDIVLNGDSGKILLIDQPEDDLDNETIYKTITKKIRDLKLRRQIIVVTHNANIAITGDSDKLIVCQNDNEHFNCYCDGVESKELYSYKSINSNLDNRKILLIAAEILDGGKEAIRKRVRKIGYKDIFYKESSDENNV